MLVKIAENTAVLTRTTTANFKDIQNERFNSTADKKNGTARKEGKI
jgi:hypothetical protein